jgi:hypothetical protein
MFILLQVASHPSCSYWAAVGLMLAQYDGLVEGYLAAADQAAAAGVPGRLPLSREDLLFLHSNGEGRVGGWVGAQCVV